MTPPKPPRAPTDIPRERSGPTHHNRFALTPSPRPGSVATVDADEGDDWDHKTPVNASKAELMAFHIERTDATATELKQSIAATNQRIDGITGELGDLRVETGKLAGGVEQLVKVLDKQTDVFARQLDQANQRQTTIVTTETETKREIAMMPVERQRSALANWRTIVLAFFGGGGVVFIVLAFITSGKAC